MYAVSTLHLVTIYKHNIHIINASLRHPSFLKLMQISIQRYELRFAHAVIYFVSLRVKETSLRETNPEGGSTRSKGRNLKTFKGLWPGPFVTCMRISNIMKKNRYEWLLWLVYLLLQDTKVHKPIHTLTYFIHLPYCLFSTQSFNLLFKEGMM